MTAFTDTMENELLNRYLKNTTTMTPVATTYFALGTAGSDSAFTEVANSNNYARKSITWGTVASGSVSISGTHTFQTATGGNWGDMSHVRVLSSGTYGSGDAYFWGALTATVTINNGDTFEFASAAVSITLD